MRQRWYVLNDDGDPVPVSDVPLDAWEDPRRILRRDRSGDVWVSTVFLPLDHGFDDGPPVLWETAVFRDDTGMVDHYQERYTSREDAIAGHARIVERADLGEWDK
jgi:hypothetical protein